MSNHLISEAYKRQLGSMARNAVMVLLADKASDDGTGIWASKQRMAEEIGTTKQTVIATVKSLVADGLLVEAGHRKTPNGYTVEYSIDVDALKALPLVASHQSNSLTGQVASLVKQDDPTSQAALPDQSSSLTQTPLNPPKPPKPKETRAREIPIDWVPDPFGLGTKSRGVVDGWHPDEHDEHLEGFIAFHRSRGNKYPDWQAAWSTWVLNTVKFKRGSASGKRPANDEIQNPYVRAITRSQAARREADGLGVEFG